MATDSAAPVDALPRVLLLSAAVPETKLAGSLLLYRLFQNYPADRLRAVGPATRRGSDLLACEYRYLRPARSARLNLTRLAALKRSFESLGLLGGISLRRIEHAVGSFTPDVVVSVMERRDYVAAAHRYCKAHGVPLVLVVHDRVESFELVYPGFRRAQIRRNARTYRFASARLCVSRQMAESLADVYGADGTILYPNRSEALTPRPTDESGHLRSPGELTVAYTGSLAYGYGDRIRDAMPALAAVGIRLRVYSHERLSTPIPGATYAGAFQPDELWQRVKADCDAVWLPYSPSSHYRPLYETHFPSKLTEYMALGMPVLITGPAYATGVQWGLQHPDAALTITGSAIEAVRDAASRLKNDPELRTRLARGSSIGDEDFNPLRIRERFVGVLRQVATRRARGAD